MASSSSSSATSQLMKTYDVFISFRGADVRDDFLSHLHDALGRNGIDAFVDDNLERGEEISKSLLQKIEDSYVSIVIFSENYAFSPWCLEELLKIQECKKTMGQIVIPVFYRVDPSHVQEMTGNYGDALVQHRQQFEDSLVESWGQALMELAALSGLVSQNIKPDSKLIDEIVNHTFEKLIHMAPSDSYNEGLVGIDSRIKCVESLLHLGTPNVRVVGIWGMAGIGKSTIAKKVYDRVKDQFTSQCFVANVRERLEKGISNSVQNEILCAILGPRISNKGNCIMLSPSIVQRLARRKVFIVLDDVSDLDQIELLIGRHDIYGSGSRIIITSRDKHLLRNVNAEIYEVEALNSNEALWLFSLHSFKQSIPKQGYKKLSERAVKYAQGNPLALKVLGSNLYCRSVEEWEDELEKLKGTSDDKIGKILRLSYDGLCENDKEIFLDIACFFNREDKDQVVSVLDRAGSRIGISRLYDKSLITISENKIHMHDLLQQMGKDITCEEKQLGKRRILWHHKDIYNLLTKDEGTELNKSISLDMSEIGEVELSPTVFERMYNLRLLKFYNSSWRPGSRIKIQLPSGLSFLPDELRLLRWDQYPLNSLPSNSFAQNLIELRLPDSQLKQLWHGAQQLGNLKLIDVSGSNELIRIPDLTTAPNVKVLDLISCRSLVEIPSSIKYLNNLVRLDASGCDNLCSLPSLRDLKSLEYFYLYCCSKITQFPELPCSIKEVGIRGTAMETLASSIGRLSQLRSLDLGSFQDITYMPSNKRYHDYFGDLPISFFECGMSIEEVPDSICNLKSLELLTINKCENLHTLPRNLGNLESLKTLRIVCSGIKELPDSICNLKFLANIYINDCVNLHALPDNLGDLESLEELHVIVTGIKQVPCSFRQLRKLKTMTFSGYKCLILPPFTGGLPCLETVNLEYCGIVEFPDSLCSLGSLEKLFIGGNDFERIPETIKQLSKLELLDLRDCKRLEYLPELPILKHLCVSNCVSLKAAFSSFQLQQKPLKLLKLGFGNCLHLDQDQRNKIMDYELAVAKNDVLQDRWRPHLWIPGHEVPQKMMYQNKSGYSLSCSLRPKDCQFLYFSAVFDPKLYHNHQLWCLEIGCRAYFTDESGHTHDAINYYFFEEKSYRESCDIVIELEHVFLWCGSLSFSGNKDDDDDHLYSIVFEFFAEEHNGIRNYDAIIVCGVHPLFKDNKDDEEEEEEPPVKRLKHNEGL